VVTYTRTYSPIKGRVFRVVLLNTCGVPVTGASSAQLVQSGFTQVQSSAEYEDGDEYIVKTADNDLCVNEQDEAILKRFSLTATICSIDPGLVPTVISTARLLTYSEAPTGTGFAIAEGKNSAHFSLEVWQRVAGSGACDPVTGAPLWVYNAWPHLFDGQIGDYNIQSEPSQLELMAKSKPVSALWTAGNAWLGSGAISVVPDHWFQNVTSVSPPTPYAGIAAYP